MPDQGVGTDAYAIQYSESGRASRKDLPPEALTLLFDILDALAANPGAFPGRVRGISLDGRIRLYSHPSPPLQVTFEVDTARRVLYLLHFVAPKVQVTKPVFISYSHKDAEWLNKLKQFLRPLEEQEMIRVWDDTEIHPGSDWLAEIRKALRPASPFSWSRRTFSIRRLSKKRNCRH
jgi:TIR domain